MLGLTLSLPSLTYAEALSYQPDTPITIPETVFNDTRFDWSVATPLTPDPFTIDINFDGISDISLFNEKYYYTEFFEDTSGDVYYSNTIWENTEFVEITTTGDVDRTSPYNEGELVDKSQPWVDEPYVGNPFPDGINPLFAYTIEWQEACDDFLGYLSCYDNGSSSSGFLGLSTYSPLAGPYIGFSFMVDGEEHYAWARYFQEKIYKWGWETEAGVAIAAGTGAAVVPLPAAVWLFGSGLIGLIGVARSRRQ